MKATLCGAGLAAAAGPQHGDVTNCCAGAKAEK